MFKKMFGSSTQKKPQEAPVDIQASKEKLSDQIENIEKREKVTQILADWALKFPQKCLAILDPASLLKRGIKDLHIKPDRIFHFLLNFACSLNWFLCIGTWKQNQRPESAGSSKEKGKG